MVQRYNIFRYLVIFFRARGVARGVVRGCAWAGGRGWVGCGGKRAAARGPHKEDGTAARRDARAQATTAPRRRGGARTAAHGGPHKPRGRRPRRAARRRPRAGPGSGRRAWGCAGECFTWNIIATGSLSVRYGSPHSPRLLQTYRNCPSNTLLGPWLRGYICKHAVTDVNNGRLQM